MKFGTVLFLSSAYAQENYDYGLDGAATNPVAYDGNYNYGSYGNYADEGERLREKPNNNDLSSILANLLGSSSYSYDYDNAYSTDYNDVLAQINAAEAMAGTTESPPDYGFNIDSFYESYDGTSEDNAVSDNAVNADASAEADAGRPESANDADTVKLFENFVDDTASDQFAQALLDDQQTYCWSCHGVGSDSTASLADCIANGSSVNCLDQGEKDYCMVSLRQVNGQITQIESGCAQKDTCNGIDNFYDNARMDWMKDQCKPGYALTNTRNRNRESKCSICHYTAKTYGEEDPTEVTDDGTADNTSKMIFDGTDVKIVGETVDETVTLTSMGLEWGNQPNNVLDVFTPPE